MNINSIQRMLFSWPTFHIREKSVKRISPFCANFYASTTIVRVALNLFIGASLLHLSLRFVLWGFTHAVLKLYNRKVVQFEASARFCMPILEFVLIGKNSLAANANTFIKGCIPSQSISGFDDREPIKNRSFSHNFPKSCLTGNCLKW